MSKKLSTLDITAANGAASSSPASQGTPALLVTVAASSGMIRSESISIPGRRIRPQQKITTSSR